MRSLLTDTFDYYLALKARTRYTREVGSQHGVLVTRHSLYGCREPSAGIRVTVKLMKIMSRDDVMSLYDYVQR